MAIYKVHKITGEQYTQLASGLRSPMDIKVYHKQRQLQSTHNMLKYLDFLKSTYVYIGDAKSVFSYRSK